MKYFCPSLQSLQEQDVLEAIIGKLLNLGKLQEAQQLVNLFDYNSWELTLVLVSVCEVGEEGQEEWLSEWMKAFSDTVGY